ncbi:hypothetical protein yinte0001_29060 [Yersinia intermedia ATCC 29909]|nr:hypothetical protein yinte0001_29060 [Yersinia intermedia ATCC 29909]
MIILLSLLLVLMIKRVGIFDVNFCGNIYKIFYVNTLFANLSMGVID